MGVLADPEIYTHNYLFVHPYRWHVRCSYKEIHKVGLIPE
jgi:hypothetical protein